MKQLSTYITEKLVLNKDTFKNNYKYFPKTKQELKDIIKQLLKERKDDSIIDLNDIDTSEITDMSELFLKNSNIRKIDISNWNVSNVENMKNMFNDCINLTETGDLSKWNVSKVKDMGFIFFECIKLKSIGDLSSWDVSKVIDMRFMFCQCGNLKSIGDISVWNVSNVENMVYMFGYSGIKNKPFWYKEK